MAKHLLPLIPPGLVVEAVRLEAERVVILTRPRSPTAACPLCHCRSGRLHSHYLRTLADLPCHGRRVVILLQTRRWRCPTPGCARRIFTERLPEVVRPYGRRSERLGDLQRQLGLALGGEAGARLALRLSLPISGDTLLRLVRRDAPAPVEQAPRVLGVDDWAWRRGRRYGTILCDLEQGRVVDLLPDRDADTLAAWLLRHPRVAIVARDRAGAYADGVRRGAPEAIQVADRWHLLRNASDALLWVLERHRGVLAKVARAVVDEATMVTAPAPRRPTKLEERRQRRQANRDAQFERVGALSQSGLGTQAIARTTGFAHNTVRNWLRAGAAPSWRKGQKACLIDPFLPYIVQRLGEGERNATRLWREIRALGFTGQAVGARARIATLKAKDPSLSTRVAAPAWSRPTARRTAHLVLCGDEMAGLDGCFLAKLIDPVPEIGRAVSEARAFATLVRERDNAGLGPWLERCRDGPLRSLAASLSRDHAAVEAALSLPWSTSPVEGQINRLKLIKRTMYGRAHLDLLRARVLAS
jgi:transposase